MFFVLTKPRWNQNKSPISTASKTTWVSKCDFLAKDMKQKQWLFTGKSQNPIQITKKIPSITYTDFPWNLGKIWTVSYAKNELTNSPFNQGSTVMFAKHGAVGIDSVATYRVCIARMAFNIFNHVHTYGPMGFTCSDLGNIQIFVAMYGWSYHVFFFSVKSQCGLVKSRFKLWPQVVMGYCRWLQCWICSCFHSPVHGWDLTFQIVLCITRHDHTVMAVY